MNKFHKGELSVQEKAGVASMASRIGGSIKTTIHPVAQNFLRHMEFVVAASIDAEGSVWASVVTGNRGFIVVPDERGVRIPSNAADALLVSNIASTGRIGLLAIELETRLRIRLNGRAVIIDGVIEIEAEEVFSNCQKYIQARERDGDQGLDLPRLSWEGEALSPSQTRLIENADTLFIASYHPERGADVSHRGGNPGFIKVEDNRTLLIPDYSGNNMFQTLGNIEDNGKAGLLFVDFESGTSLQMTGSAEIIWDQREFLDLPGANRAVRFSLEKVLETEGAFPAGWRFIGYSPVNP